MQSPVSEPNQDNFKSNDGDIALHVCMVEDDKYYWEFVRRLLATRKNPTFLLHHAASMKEARDFLREETPDVILLDLNLPDSRGLRTLAEVKEVSEAPIIIITGSDDEELGLQSVTHGAQDYLVKQQVSKDSLVRSIRYAIERRKTEVQTLRLAAIKDFTATLAHDLSVPLIGAQNVVDGLLRGNLGALTEEQKEALMVLKESTMSELSLVKRLLEIYRYESDSSHFQMNPLAVDHFLSHYLSQFLRAKSTRLEAQENRLERQPINVVVEPSAAGSRILGDEEALSSLLDSLVENAQKFGDPTRAIEIRARCEHGQVVISVHNWGTGISPEVKKNLFLRFWQGVPGKTYVARTGLGLYLCDRIAQLHQGRMICESAEESGTEIGVRFRAYTE